MVTCDRNAVYILAKMKNENMLQKEKKTCYSQSTERQMMPLEN